MFTIKNNEGKFWATCGWSQYQARAFKFKTLAEAQAELKWALVGFNGSAEIVEIQG